MNDELAKTSAEWQKIYPNVIVFDPDGWDRTNYDYSWNIEKISLKEYNNRKQRSTIIIRNEPIECK